MLDMLAYTVYPNRLSFVYRAGTSCLKSPPPVSHGYYVGACAIPATTYMSGTICNIMCEAGYAPTTMTMTSVCDGGRWVTSGTCAPLGEPPLSG